MPQSQFRHFSILDTFLILDSHTKTNINSIQSSNDCGATRYSPVWYLPRASTESYLEKVYKEEEPNILFSTNADYMTSRQREAVITGINCFIAL